MLKNTLSIQRLLMLLNLYLFNCQVNIVLIALNTVVASTMAAVAAYFNSQNGADHISRFWGRLNLALSGVSMSVSGHEFIDENQSYITMANHQSYYDVFALIGYLPLPLKWVMKMELRKIPVFGIACEKIVRRYGPVLLWSSSPKARGVRMANSKVLKKVVSLWHWRQGCRYFP